MPEEELIPLTRWIHGRVRMHFRGGHVADVPLTLEAAHSLRKQIENKQGAETIDGLEAHFGWVDWKGEEVVMTEWDPLPDYGWPSDTLEDRQRLTELGMHHGVLQALAQLWAELGHHNATYSGSAVAALHRLATRETVSREEWNKAAKSVEGKTGAELLRSLGPHDPTSPPTPPTEPGRTIVADDAAEPETVTAVGPQGGSTAVTGDDDSPTTGSAPSAPATKGSPSGSRDTEVEAPEPDDVPTED